jgi:hypothetical protein
VLLMVCSGVLCCCERRSILTRMLLLGRRHGTAESACSALCHHTHSSTANLVERHAL